MANVKHRMPFTSEDMRRLEAWLVQNHPVNENRSGNQIWKELVEDTDTLSWSRRHPWSSWREHYRSNEGHYIKAISKAIKLKAMKNEARKPDEAPPHKQTNSSKQTENRHQVGEREKSKVKQRSVWLSSSSEDEQGEVEDARPKEKKAPATSSVSLNDEDDITNLAEYFASEEIQEPERMMATTFQDLINEPACKKWAKKKAGVQWRTFYRENKRAIDKQVENLMGKGSSRRDTSSKSLKRRRGSEDESGTEKNDETDQADVVPMTKKRRLSDRGSTAVSRKAPTVSSERWSSPKKVPTTIVQGTPSTPSEVQDFLEPVIDPISPQNNEGTPRLGVYGIIGTPSGSVNSSIVDDEEDSLVRTPIATGTEIVEGTTYISPLRLTPTPEVEKSADASHSPPTMIEIGMEDTPISVVEAQPPKSIPDFRPLKLGIFPRDFSNLTPILRPGQNGKQMPPLDMDNAQRVTLKANEPAQGRAVTALITPPFSPSVNGTKDGAVQGEAARLRNEGDIALEGDSAQYVSADDMYWGMTEQPSPMPELVSEGPSSRSHSIAYERLSELLGARAQPEHQYRHIADAEEEVDELVDDPLEPESLPPPTPRFIVARKSTNYQSKSPLFASSSSTDDEKPVKSKEPNRNVRYPVKAQVKAAGLVRQRISQPSKPHVVSSDEEEEIVQHRIESKHIASVGDVNKENTRSQEGIVESTAFEAPVDDPQSHGVKPPRRSNIYMVHHAIEGDEKDPEEKRLPAKELDLTGKTPPSPKEPVRTIKLDVITPDFDEIVRKTLDNVTLGEEKMPNIGSKVRYALSRSVPAFNKNRITKFAAKNGPRMSLSHPLRGSDSEDGLEEPSPLKGKDEKVQYDDDEENAGEGAKTRVRFDGVPANRQRRKTTGGVGFTFGMGTVHGKSQGVASETIPGPSNLSRGDYLSFPKPKDVMDARKHGDGVVDLSDDDEKQSEDSPLARYSHAATSSPQKSVAKSVQMRYGRSSLGGRSSQGYIPPPPAKKIPVVDSSSPPTRRSSVQPSPTPHLQERNKAIVRNPQMRNVAIQEFAEAKWSPFRFSQTQSQSQRTLDSQAYFASQSQVGSQMAERYLIDAEDQEGSVVTNTGLSMDYRDQHADAEWVQTVHGRPVLTAREINRDRRSAPIPSKDDVVVYSSSRAPSRRGSPSRARSSDPASRSRRRSRRKSELELDERTFRLMSDADKRIVWKYLVDHQVIEPDDEIEPAVMVDGLAYQLEHLARVYGLGSRVPRTVWYECGDLVMTKEVLDEMSGGAEQKGEQKLASYETALGNDELLRRQDQVRRRAKSGRSSFGEGRQGRARQFVDRLMAATARGANDDEDDDSLSESDEDESEGDSEDGAGFVRGRPEPRRSAGVSRRGETPEYVPLAVVVQP